MVAKVDALYREGLALFRQGKLMEAVAKLEAAVAQDDRHADALEALGVLYGRLDRFDDAIRIMQRLAGIDPHSVMAHTNLSIFYMRKGMKEEAEQEKALATVAAFSHAGEASAPPAERQAPPSSEEQTAARRQEMEKFRKMLALDPNDAVLRVSLGKLYLEDGRHDAAIEELYRAVSLKPDYSVAYEQLGRTLEAAGRRREAVPVYIEGIAVAERNGDLTPQKIMEHRLKLLQGSR